MAGYADRGEATTGRDKSMSKFTFTTHRDTLACCHELSEAHAAEMRRS